MTILAPGSKRLEGGAKARQREDSCDRNLPFSTAVREAAIPATDLDLLITNGADEMRTLLEITCPDERVYSPENYLLQIDERRNDPSSGNHNDSLISLIASKLGCPALLVVFEPDLRSCPETSPIWWRPIEQPGKWKKTTATRFLKSLKDFAFR